MNVWVMSLALIQMLLVLMGIIQPLIHTTIKGSLNLTTVEGFAFSSISGLLNAFIFTTNNNKSITEKEAILQNFYGCCISACFAPFMVLKEVSDRRKLTHYTVSEVQLLGVICVIAMVQQWLIDVKLRSRYFYSE